MEPAQLVYTQHRVNNREDDKCVLNRGIYFNW